MRLLLEKFMLLGVACSLACSSSQLRQRSSLTEAESFEKDEDFAELPTAVSGGLFLLECTHKAVRITATESESNCSVMMVESGEKANLDDNFSTSSLQVNVPDGVTMVKNANSEDMTSHWTIKLTKDGSDLPMSEVLSSTEFKFQAETLDGESIEETTNSVTEVSYSTIDDKDTKYKTRKYLGSTYVLGKLNESCNTSCAAVDSVFDLNATKKINKERECEEIFEKFGDSRFNRNVSIVHKPASAIAKEILKNVDDVGCSEAKEKGSKQYHHIFSRKIDEFAQFTSKNPGRRICGCE